MFVWYLYLNPMNYWWIGCWGVSWRSHVALPLSQILGCVRGIVSRMCGLGEWSFEWDQSSPFPPHQSGPILAMECPSSIYYSSRTCKIWIFIWLEFEQVATIKHHLLLSSWRMRKFGRNNFVSSMGPMLLCMQKINDAFVNVTVTGNMLNKS